MLVYQRLVVKYIWGFPEMVVPPVIIQFSGIFHEINQAELGDSPFMETPYVPIIIQVLVGYTMR